MVGVLPVQAEEVLPRLPTGQLGEGGLRSPRFSDAILELESRTKYLRHQSDGSDRSWCPEKNGDMRSRTGEVGRIFSASVNPLTICPGTQ